MITPRAVEEEQTSNVCVYIYPGMDMHAHENQIMGYHTSQRTGVASKIPNKKCPYDPGLDLFPRLFKDVYDEQLSKYGK